MTLLARARLHRRDEVPELVGQERQTAQAPIREKPTGDAAERVFVVVARSGPEGPAIRAPRLVHARVRLGERQRYVP